MKEVIATKLLVHSMPFATKDLASVLTRTRSRLTSEDGYCLDYDFLENDPSTYVCGALANLPNLDHINVDDDSERLDVWYYSRFMHTKGMGKIFSNWLTLSDRFLSEQRIENAFLTVGFVSEFDDLELTYRSAGDSAAVYDIDLNPGDRFIDEHEEFSCEYLNRLLGFLSAFDNDFKKWLEAAEGTTRKWDKIAKQSDESARRIWAHSRDIALPQKMVDLITELKGTLMKIDWGA